MSALVSRSSCLTTTARLAADGTYTLIVATMFGSSCASWVESNTIFDSSGVKHSSTYGLHMDQIHHCQEKSPRQV
eukprot:1461751-Pyramimonas_sp.AAC.1